MDERRLPPDTADVGPSCAPDRKPYEKPVLQVYGDLSELTQSMTGSMMNDGAGHPNKHFTS
jgi:hypothetical protein